MLLAARSPASQSMVASGQMRADCLKKGPALVFAVSSLPHGFMSLGERLGGNGRFDLHEDLFSGDPQY